jgi:hypothetical protein
MFWIFDTIWWQQNAANLLPISTKKKFTKKNDQDIPLHIDVFVLKWGKWQNVSFLTLDPISK